MTDDESSAKTPAVRQSVQVTEEELRWAFSGPAVHSNKMYLTISGTGVRLAFMEQQGKPVPPQFRTAVIMSYDDAFSLRDLLIRQLEPIEKAIKSAPTVTAKGNGD